MTHILSAVNLALVRSDPNHVIPFHSIVPYLTDPTPIYIVRVETLAGICKATLTDLTPDHTIRHVQCAYRATQLVEYLASANLVVPPSFCQLVTDKLYDVGYVPINDFWVSLQEPALLDAIERGPTDFRDTFAVQLCDLCGQDKRVQLSTTTLGQLGLASNIPLTLTVAIRPDRADIDATQSPSDALRQRLDTRNDWLRGRNVRAAFNDRALAYEIVRQEGCVLEYASGELQADRAIVTMAVQRDGYALQYASKELQADRAIVTMAVQQTGYALQFASEELQTDRAIVAMAVQQNGHALYYASDDFKAEREFMVMAVQQNGYALYYASDDRRADRNIVAMAVQKNGRALYYASKELQADREIVTRAIQQIGCALEFASRELRADRAIVAMAIQQDGYALRFASKELKADREIVAMAVQRNGRALQFASSELQADLEL